jgi:phenylacetic acid degradation protein
MFPGKSIVLKQGAHVGHGAIIHGANLGRNTMVGMNSVIMDGAVIADECIVGAMAFVKAESYLPQDNLLLETLPRLLKRFLSKCLPGKPLAQNYTKVFLKIATRHSVK